jgi:hypothetical protein
MALPRVWLLGVSLLLVQLVVPPAAGAAGRYKTVVYHGVEVSVPSSWPVLTGMHTQQCGTPFTSQPTVYLGLNLNPGPHCAVKLRPTPSSNGVWMQTGRVTGRLSTLKSGVRVHFTTPEVRTPFRSNGTTDVLTQGQPYEFVGYRGIQVEVGIGPDPDVAQRIVESVRAAPDKPNTRAGEACWIAGHPPSMPQPQRLSKRLILDEGTRFSTITLAPATHDVRPRISAATAWRKVAPKSLIDRYRVVLANFSSLFPAHISQGSPTQTPTYQDVTSWVILSTPGTTKYSGCGSYGVTPVNAHTGKILFSTSW